jgi:murein L,D-transpeptidase YcbB/YkuD
LQRGDRSERVIRLRLRLAAEGFLTNAVADDSTQFDIDIDPALKKFQLQNGLEANGILGANTFKTLNISAHQRVRQIVVNMERWCWLPQMLGDRYILARISKTGNSLGCSYAGATTGSLNPF